MDKSTVTMMNWELYVYRGRYRLSGTADHHPVLGRNVYIAQTSDLVSSKWENDVLFYETRNTIYQCPLKYMSTNPYGNVMDSYKEKLSHLDEESDSVLDKIIAAAAKIATGKTDEFAEDILRMAEEGKKELEQREEADNQRMFAVIRDVPDCVFLEVNQVEFGDKLAYHIGERFGTVEPVLHSGMFQDSILYTKYEMEEDDVSLDFRYFPRGYGSVMKTYSWSDNIKCAVIKNEKEYEIMFNNEKVEPGETKIFFRRCTEKVWSVWIVTMKTVRKLGNCEHLKFCKCICK